MWSPPLPWGAICRWNHETKKAAEIAAKLQEDSGGYGPSPTPGEPSPEGAARLEAVRAERQATRSTRGRALYDRLAGIVNYLMDYWKIVRRDGQVVTVLYKEDRVPYLITRQVDARTGTATYAARLARGAELLCLPGALDHLFVGKQKPDPAVQPEVVKHQITHLINENAILHVLDHHVVTGLLNQETLPDTGWTDPVDLAVAMAAGKIPKEPPFAASGSQQTVSQQTPIIQMNQDQEGQEIKQFADSIL